MKTLNRGLRLLLGDVTKVGYLRLPFSDIFYSIREQYEATKAKLFGKKDEVTVYRGAKFTER